MSLQLGARFGPYNVVSRLGAGGMGEVYRAWDDRLQRPLAIKTLGEACRDAAGRARLIQEARAASGLNHPHICVIYEVGEIDDEAYLAMEFIDGHSLAAQLAGGPLPIDQVLRYGGQVADALSHAHARGIVHRDLKSPNVLVGADGRLRVVDFGLAKYAEPADRHGQSATRLTQPGTVVGTLTAMSPEQLRGESADVRSDIWALGVLLHEMASGGLPFPGQNTFEVSTAILRDPPVPLPSTLPAAFGALVGKCLEKLPAARFQRVSEVGEALAALQVTSSVTGGVTARTSGPVTVMPPALDAEPRTRFVGRGAEWTELTDVWQQVCQGHRQVLLLSGEPGIGKTRLATEFAQRSLADGAVVLFGRCDEEVLVPYQPFVESLGHYVSACTESDLRRDLSGASGAELTRLLPEVGRRLINLPPPSTTDAEGQRYRLFEAVAALLAGIAAVRPVLLVLDDLHWADKASLLLLRHLARGRTDLALCIVGTYRDTDLSRTHPLADLLADLRRDHGVARVALKGLTQDEVRGVIDAWAGAGAAAGLASAVAAETEGNPFFVTEVIRHLAETGALTNPTPTRGGFGIPEGVKDVIGRRLSRLTEATNRVLTQAAVVGRTFGLDVLAAMGTAGEDDLLDAMDEASRAGIVVERAREPGRFTFAHALIRETVYGELSVTRRARLHQRVGEALESLGNARGALSLADLAYHFLHAASAPLADKAIDYAERAALAARASLALEEAASYYDMALQALELHGHDEATESRRGLLHAQRGHAFASIGLWALARPEFERALALCPAADEQRRAELLSALAMTHFWLLDIAGMRPYAEETLTLGRKIGRNDLSGVAMAWLARARQSDGDLIGTIEMDREALEETGGVRSAAMAQAPLALYLVGRFADALTESQQMVVAARQSGEVAFLVHALAHLGLSLAGSGRYGEAMAAFAEAGEFGGKYGARPQVARAIAMSGGYRMDVFDYAGAEAIHHEARELAKSANFPPTVISAGIDLVLNYVRRGDPGRAEPMLPGVEEAVAKAAGWHGWLWRLRLLQANAEVALARGETDNALLHANKALEMSRAGGRLKYEVLALVARGRARQAAAGRHDESVADYRAALDRARTGGDPALMLTAAHALLVADGDDALALEVRTLVDRMTERLPAVLQPVFHDSTAVVEITRLVR